ncbi:MAG TPA: hypothetical protein VMB83_00630 [Roseiarcus sp.]|nr:hypothetical protein [Roseiarcus sp.]
MIEELADAPQVDLAAIHQERDASREQKMYSVVEVLSMAGRRRVSGRQCAALIAATPHYQPTAAGALQGGTPSSIERRPRFQAGARSLSATTAASRTPPKMMLRTAAGSSTPDSSVDKAVSNNAPPNIPR